MKKEMKEMNREEKGMHDNCACQDRFDLFCEGERSLIKMKDILSSQGYVTEPVISKGVYGLKILKKVRN